MSLCAFVLVVFLSLPMCFLADTSPMGMTAPRTTQSMRDFHKASHARTFCDVDVDVAPLLRNVWTNAIQENDINANTATAFIQTPTEKYSPSLPLIYAAPSTAATLQDLLHRLLDGQKKLEEGQKKHENKLEEVQKKLEEVQKQLQSEIREAAALSTCSESSSCHLHGYSVNQASP
jgi:hypothetical protein